MNNSSHSRLRFTGAALLTAALLGLAGCSKDATPTDSATAKAQKNMSDSSTVALESNDQRVSYGIALNIGSNIARQGGLEVDSAAFLAGKPAAATATE